MRCGSYNTRDHPHGPEAGSARGGLWKHSHVRATERRHISRVWSAQGRGRSIPVSPRRRHRLGALDILFGWCCAAKWQSCCVYLQVAFQYCGATKPGRDALLRLRVFPCHDILRCRRDIEA
ncbi:hypothetical protein PHLGIDRAFT_351520 [Phlebiopsis gigantea 11061_1 CR5-6]|uniref:Uncharacterized protein n=1 Tax=Phlebiopsis gigantea (strain 11061_1 CR5-6) TaxID=745531 RepID=A0A0C3SCR3_PHLG1|nr:hypothetical protein PHLGIDRAFT_351520 [Phlebiopsis gigantea 11061_1 CR5-6]